MLLNCGGAVVLGDANLRLIGAGQHLRFLEGGADFGEVGVVRVCGGESTL
ncbi:MAG: hypothetical protein RLZZ511_2602 [Cyanobacteriota bacterium]|jgi:hypothetical protein